MSASQPIDIQAVKRAIARRKYLESLYERTHFYAEVNGVEDLPGFRLWSDCRLYLEPPRGPAPNELHGCLGAVWLHNPSTAFELPAIPHAWGPIGIKEPGQFRANTLNYVTYLVQRALDDAGRNSALQNVVNPHINLAELVYLDSGSITGLWWGLRSSAIKPYSHVGTSAKHPPAPNTTDFKFLWLAWGDLANCSFRHRLFLPLTAEAMNAAVHADTDLIFVTEELILNPIELKLPVYHWSRRRESWIKYWTGEPEQVPGGKEALPTFFRPFSPQPQHPQSLRTLEGPRLTTVERNLIAAISDSLRS
jgi:hypothetical protein